MCTKNWAIGLTLLIIAVIETPPSAEAASQPTRTHQVQIVAEKMCCKGCAQKVAGQLYAAPGVTAVDADLENKTIAVTVSRRKGASLEQLWQAVAVGEGGPTRLTTAEATFTMTRSEALTDNSLPPLGTTQVVIDNLHCQGCARKIAAKLYAIRGVSKVSADMKQNTMVIQSKGKELSPWALVRAVTGAKERPLAIVGASGRMDIAWSTPKTVNAHQMSSHSKKGGFQR